MRLADRGSSLGQFLARIESARVDDATARLLNDLDDLEAYARTPKAMIDLVPTARERLIKHLGSRRRTNASRCQGVSSDPVMEVVNELDAMAGQPGRQRLAQGGTAGQVNGLLGELFSKVLKGHDFGEADSYTDPSITLPVSNEPDGDVRNAFIRITDFERKMRDLIDSELTRVRCEDWEKQSDLGRRYTRWRGKRDKAPADASSSERPIDYADFGEYRQIIVEDECWNEVFHRYFLSKAAVEDAFRHLNPIRRAVMHSRPITRKQELRLYFETNRLLRWVDTSRLH